MANEVLDKASSAVVSAAGSALPAVRGELVDSMLLALRRLRQIIEPELTADDLQYELKKCRLVGDMALGILRLGLQARESEAHVRRDQALVAILDELAAERRAKAVNPK